MLTYGRLSQVVYLFRLDANEKAEKFLALAISHAHHLGFHRSKVVRRMPVFNDEMIRRLWWSLYALDRRLAIETGHPFLIQDVNVDAPHPQNLDDEWLTRHKESRKSSDELGYDIKAALSKNPTTPIPYLSATIRYSRVVGRIWEAIYGANMTDVIPSSSLLEYLDQLISRAQVEVRPEFSDSHQPEPPNLERSNPLRWLTKQQMLMRIVRNFSILLPSPPVFHSFVTNHIPSDGSPSAFSSENQSSNNELHPRNPSPKSLKQKSPASESPATSFRSSNKFPNTRRLHSPSSIH